MICKISDLLVSIPETGGLAPRLGDYRSSEEACPDIIIREDRYKLHRWRNASHELAVYLESGFQFYRHLLRFNGMMLHASAVELDGKAYLFSAPSRTGKSTHTSLWMKEFTNARIINDDKPAIRIEADGIFVYGTPWSGKNNEHRNVKVPLHGIAFLQRGNENKIVPCDGKIAIQKLLEQTIRPSEKKLVSLLLDHISALVERVPIYLLTCTPEPAAAHVSYETMKNGVIK